MRRLLQPDPDRAAEIASQREFLLKFDTTRMLATFVVALLMSLFLPLWVVLLFQGLDYLFEAAGFWLIDGLDPDRMPGRYRLTLITVFLMEASFIIPAAMIWTQDDAYCKALAVGLVCMTLFQLASVRAIHLPFGVAGMLGALATGVHRQYDLLAAARRLGGACHLQHGDRGGVLLRNGGDAPLDTGSGSNNG